MFEKFRANRRNCGPANLMLVGQLLPAFVSLAINAKQATRNRQAPYLRRPLIGGLNPFQDGQKVLCRAD